MKCVIIIVVAFLLYTFDVTSASSDLIKKKSKTCQTSEKASDKDVDDFAAGTAPSTPEGKCLIACMGKQYSVIKDNKISKAGFVSVVSLMGTDAEKKKLAGEVADACIEITDADRCESAYKIWKCVEDEAEKLGFTLF